MPTSTRADHFCTDPHVAYPGWEKTSPTDSGDPGCCRRPDGKTGTNCHHLDNRGQSWASRKLRGRTDVNELVCDLNQGRPLLAGKLDPVCCLQENDA